MKFGQISHKYGINSLMHLVRALMTGGMGESGFSVQQCRTSRYIMVGGTYLPLSVVDRDPLVYVLCWLSGIDAAKYNLSSEVFRSRSARRKTPATNLHHSALS
jgi:hypothetical protein